MSVSSFGSGSVSRRASASAALLCVLVLCDTECQVHATFALTDTGCSIAVLCQIR